ncbi:MAG: nucleoside hydrolase [Clostridia bacterium]|nr:nucleoside hydrolase [Clostridia bacterium]
MKNKLTALLLITAMLLSVIPFTGVAAESYDVTLTDREYVDSASVYKDVAQGAWYCSAVDYVSTYGIMGGAGSADTFKPSDLSTRAMIAVILHRIEGEPAAAEKAPFTDVTADWCRPAIDWAYETGVVKGSSATTFNPNGNITRQELLTMLYRYVEYKGLDKTGVGDLEEFPDYKQVADWAWEGLAWGVCQGFVRGRGSGDSVTLAPAGNSQRDEMATVFLRFCEKYDLVEEADVTIDDIFADLRSNRVKKVIFDADSGNEMDDQYALAYAVASETMDVLAVNATLFLNTALVPTFEEGMMEGYRENKRILDAIGHNDIPQFKGCAEPITKSPGYSPVASEASDNIIKTANASSEIIYVVATGALTNVASAILKDPTITGKICVVWMGGGGQGTGDGGGFNSGQDYKAAQFVLNSGVPFVMLPGAGPKGGGTDALKGDKALLAEAFPGDDTLSTLFRETLPRECDPEHFDADTNYTGEGKWWHIFWDLAAVALFECNDGMDLEIITAPRIRNDMSMAENEAGRHKIICMNSLDVDAVFDQAFGYISDLIAVHNFKPMTIEEILADIKSDRVKKVIFDADAGNEIDDQYAFAYALGSDKIDVVSASASQFWNTALVPTREAGMLEGYNELKRVLGLVGREDVPVYKGCGDSVTKSGDDGVGLPTVKPINSDAVDNIINTAKASGEVVYVVVSGCATNISSAIAKDPSIKDKICVIWLGSNHVDYGGADEFNMGQDRTAGRYLMNCGVNLIWLPAMSKDSTKGTQSLKSDKAFLQQSFTGTDAASRYFREELALEHDGSYDSDGWVHTFWDVAAVTVLDRPDLCSFSIVTCPRVRGDGTFDTSDNSRHKVIILDKLQPVPALNVMAETINSLIK